MYILSLDKNFAPFLELGFTWQKQSARNTNRGLVDDIDPIPEDEHKTAVQKNTQLALMLGQIANFAPIISKNSILKGFTGRIFGSILAFNHQGHTFWI